MEENITALKTIYSLIENYNQKNSEKILWVLTGSLSLILQGVDIPFSNDIDILTDRLGSEIMNKLLSNFVIKESKYSGNDKYKSYFGIYQILGVQIEIIGDLQYLSKEGVRTEDNLNHNVITKKLYGMNLPMFDLSYELKVYKGMGRIEKAEKIKERIESENRQ